MRFVSLDALPVEITNHTDWWQPWLPVGTGLLVASVAFAGVLISNRTNRLAIAAADGREADVNGQVEVPGGGQIEVPTPCGDS